MVQNVRKEQTAITVLAILYVVGILGVAIPIHEDFLLLTPMNLLISLGVALWFHPHWSKRTIFFLVLCYFTGFFAEVFGVQTGILFGSYEYGRVLGWKIWETPLMIGVNWVLLAYCSGVTVNELLEKKPWWIKAGIASLLMVVLDMLIEPVAMQYDFWSWEDSIVPVRNYFGWFLVAFPLLSIFAILQGHIKNKVGIALLIMQFAFFLALRII